MRTTSAVTHTDALGYASPRKWVTADRAEQIRVMSADRAERIRGRTVAGPPKHAAPDSPRTPTAKTRPKSAPFSAPVRPRAARQMLEAAGGRGTSAFTHSPADGVQFLGRARRAEVVFTHNARALLAGEPALLTLKISAARPEDLFYVREVRQLDPRTVGSRVEVTLLRPHVTVEEKLLTLGDVRLEDGHDCAVPLRLQAVLEGGHALLSVLLDGRHVRGSPYPISVRSAAPFAPAAVLVAPDGSKVEAHAVAGERATLTLLLHDRYGNVAKSGAVAKRPAVHARLVAFGAPDVAHPAASPGAAARADAAAAGAIDLSVRDLGNGRYALGYSVTVAGSYQAELAVGGAAVSTPLCVHVHPAAPCDARCTFEYAPVVGGSPDLFDPRALPSYRGDVWAPFAGRECTLRLIARDAFGNACSAESAASSASGWTVRLRPTPPAEARPLTKNLEPPPPKKPAVVEHGRVRVVGQAAEGNVIVDCRLVAQAPGPHLLEVRAPGGGHAVGSPRHVRVRPGAADAAASTILWGAQEIFSPRAHRRPKFSVPPSPASPRAVAWEVQGGLKPPPISPGAAGGEGPLSAQAARRCVFWVVPRDATGNRCPAGDAALEVAVEPTAEEAAAEVRGDAVEAARQRPRISTRLVARADEVGGGGGDGGGAEAWEVAFECDAACASAAAPRRVHITLDGESLGPSPLLVDVRPGVPCAECSVIEGLPPRGGGVVGTPSAGKLLLRDAAGNTCRHILGSRVEATARLLPPGARAEDQLAKYEDYDLASGVVELTELGGGEMEIRIGAERAGRYGVRVAVDGDVVSNGRFAFDFAAATAHAQSTALVEGSQLEGLYIPANVRLAIRVATRDRFGNLVPAERRGKDLKLALQAYCSCCAEVTVTDEGGGLYTVSFATEAATLGAHVLEITLDGNHIVGSPFSFKVGAGAAHASRCTACGAGVRTAAWNRPTTFTIVARDAFGHEIKKGGDDFHVSVAPRGHGHYGTVESVNDLGDGNYAVEYTAAISGRYGVEVRLGGVHIEGSPFPIEVKQPADGSGGSPLSPRSPGYEYSKGFKPPQYSPTRRPPPRSPRSP